jgi:hypothetical protein
MHTDQTNTRQGVSYWSAFRFRRASFAALALSAFAAAPALGAPVKVAAGQDPSEESSFALDFGGYGGVSSALIAQTDFELEIDAAAGTAHFNRYDQDIAPLLLPGGISTGNIRVEVVPKSSTGTYNSATGEFATSEVYAIYFDGNLTAYGLTSPVLLPSTSVGVVDAASSSVVFVNLNSSPVGSVTLNWAGAGQLNNPYDPNSLIDFSYVCSIYMTFTIDAPSFITTAMIPKVESNVSSSTIESTLVAPLTAALTDLAANNQAGDDRAVVDLNKFMMKVSRFAGGADLTAAEANSLIADAKYAIYLIRDPVHTISPLPDGSLTDSANVKNAGRDIVPR